MFGGLNYMPLLSTRSISAHGCHSHPHTCQKYTFLVVFSFSMLSVRQCLIAVDSLKRTEREAVASSVVFYLV